MKKRRKKTLTEREKCFCYYYINTGNLHEAATFAGYRRESEKKLFNLLSEERIKEEINRLYNEKKKNLAYKACVGYERLAFGNVSDAIKLLYAENLDDLDIQSMDLFCISEIKRPKDGAMEIKFFDRIRALEKLEQAEGGNRSNVGQFYYAIEQGMKSLQENKAELRED